MSVRNFWVDVDHSSRKNSVGTGPNGKDGSLEATFYIRDRGGIKKALTVKGVTRDGRLMLYVLDDQETCVHSVDTER